MSNLTSVGVTAGVPTSGTGTVSTIDNIPALWDKGISTGGSLTQRVAIDTQQLSPLGTTVMASSSPVTIATDDTVVGAKTETAPATDTASSGLNGRLQRVSQRLTSLIAVIPSALGQTTKSASLSTTIASDQALGYATTVSTSVTRPANTTTYTTNTAIADSTSSPTAGGFTLTGAARISGGSGVITDLVITSSADPTLLLQAELWIFDQAVTAINDDASFSISDGDILNLVGVVPFTMATTNAGTGTNSFSNVQGINLGFTCVGTANLRFLLKAKNAYVPVSGEVIQVRAKIVQTN